MFETVDLSENDKEGSFVVDNYGQSLRKADSNVVLHDFIDGPIGDS